MQICKPSRPICILLKAKWDSLPLGESLDQRRHVKLVANQVCSVRPAGRDMVYYNKLSVLNVEECRACGANTIGCLSFNPYHACRAGRSCAGTPQSPTSGSLARYEYLYTALEYAHSTRSSPLARCRLDTAPQDLSILWRPCKYG